MAKSSAVRPVVEEQRPALSKFLVILTIAASILLYFVLLATAEHSYTITDRGQTVALRTAATEVEEVLAQAGIPVGRNDRVTATADGAVTHIDIDRQQAVTITCAGESTAAETYSDTVEELLSELDMTLGEEDLLLSQGRSLGMDEQITDGMEIQLTRNARQTVTEQVAIPFETQTYLDPSLGYGETKIKTPGRDGTQEVVSLKKYVNGQLTSTSVLSSRMITAPVTQVVLVGNGEKAGRETESVLLQAPEAEAAPELEAPAVAETGEADAAFSGSGSSRTLLSAPKAEAADSEDADSKDADSAQEEARAIEAPDPEETPEEPAYQEPAYEEPEEPAYEESEYEEPEEPAYEEPEYEEPEEPAYEEPEYEEPEEPAYEEPEYEEPEYEEPEDTAGTYGGYEILDVLSIECTAYTGGGTTATGTPARYGEVAVDPSYIPYGSLLYIVSDDGNWVYGTCTAEDCGGAVNGNIVDLYYDDYDTCIQFGRRSCTAYVLRWGY